MQPQTAAPRRPATQRRELGFYTPRAFTQRCRERFMRDRRRRYLARLAGEPTDAQASLIVSLASLEWSALAAEAEGGLVASREAREHRRLFQRLLADFEKSLAPPAARPAMSLAEHNRAIAAREARSREAVA